MFLHRGWYDLVSRNWERRKLYPIDDGPYLQGRHQELHGCPDAAMMYEDARFHGQHPQSQPPDPAALDKGA